MPQAISPFLRLPGESPLFPSPSSSPLTQRVDGRLPLLCDRRQRQGLREVAGQGDSTLATGAQGFALVDPTPERTRDGASTYSLLLVVTTYVRHLLL